MSKSMFLVSACPMYESAKPIKAFLRLARAKAFVRKLNRYDKTMPMSDQFLIEGTDNVDMDSYWFALSEWRSKHPAGNNTWGGDDYHISPLAYA